MLCPGRSGKPIFGSGSVVLFRAIKFLDSVRLVWLTLTGWDSKAGYDTGYIRKIYIQSSNLLQKMILPAYYNSRYPNKMLLKYHLPGISDKFP